MQRIFSFFAIICLSLSMVLMSFDAEARRFGGGRSFGKAPSHQQTRQATPNKPAANPNQKAAPGRSWMGPLAGFVAGGLLASLFMGGFSGINFFDIIVIGLLAFFIIRFIRSRMQPQQQAVNNSVNTFQGQDNNQSPIFGTQRPATAVVEPVINAPTWFNADSFVAAAKEHFMALQEHWDANEMDKIAEYVTPELLTFLKQERAEAGDGFQSTYIDNLEVVLDGVDNDAEKTVATLTFTGVAKTSRFDQGEAFNESWRMEREEGENKPWLVAGIRQNI
ncbi:Tim44 domain-containing protein [Entomomonas sp. E2T0]|uniref:Tim44 domain-containing protein n=1 Tax=Entomomonas sp. E2T0 TaxID=2930213 RepID=UPI0022283D54|nr:Tim44 domain-containing protein [Entomomonas sp. E2T0]UYZ84821.1 Tim44 domain-containing protein [Entomomonas sp. E2T0]